MKDKMVLLPPGCILRPASAGDIWWIRKLVLLAKLDPTQLRWSQFWVIECEGQVVACAQLRSFAGARELGSLVVAPTWRDRGLGSCLVKHLIQEATEPLYLECMARLVPFYQRFGFVEIPWRSLPKPLKIKFSLSQLASILLPVRFAIMHYQGIP